MACAAREFLGFTEGISADMMMSGYRQGVFAMEYEPGLYQWWSPDPRGVLPLDNLRISRSLRKSVLSYTTTIDADFPAVLDACADNRRSGGWIDDGLAAAYLELHRRGVAHSVETWDDSGSLAGGLFVVCIGGLVCGESMFHRARDASKVALVDLVGRLRATSRPVLLDTQWRTDHLSSLGVVDMPRSQYLRELRHVIDQANVL